MQNQQDAKLGTKRHDAKIKTRRRDEVIIGGEY